MSGRQLHLAEAITRSLIGAGAPGRPLVVCCIGTDRSTGDALGPLVGHMLERAWRRPGSVIGTLESPLHALNLAERTAHLRGPEPPLVVALDAALGPLDSVGAIHLRPRGVVPGEAVGKSIPSLGEISITATVNVQAGALSNQVLQSTRLHLVHGLADLIAGALLGAVRRLERSSAALAAQEAAPAASSQV